MQKIVLPSKLELKKPTLKQHICFFADTLANAKKNKRAVFLPTRGMILTLSKKIKYI